MVEIEGEMWIGEAQGASWLLSRRVSGFGPLAFALYLVGILALDLAATTAVDLAAPKAVAGWLELPSIVVVSVAAFYGWMAWRRTSLRRGWMARGVPNPNKVAFRLEDEAFVVAATNYDIRCRWSAISEIAPTKKHWVYVGAGLGYCVPRRFFTDAAAERAFLSESLSHLGEAARARSRKAVVVAGAVT